MRRKRITTRICFYQETAKDVSECVQHFDIIVPGNVDRKLVKEKICEVHRRLTEEESGSGYKKNGQVPRYLLERMCEENGWELDDINYGINLSFDVTDATAYKEGSLY